MAYHESVERFRGTEYPMLDGKCYLDHGGTTLYPKKLIERYSENLLGNLYGNPHSASAPSKLSGTVVDDVREKTLRFLGADPEHFDLIFTANATAAIKLVAESFRDLALESSPSGEFWYGYHKDAHTSLVGVREYTNGHHHCFKTDSEVDDWLSCRKSPPNRPDSAQKLGLFAFPGQSNMTGRRLPLSWAKALHQSRVSSHQSTYSLLDAAALATTTQLDLSDPEAAPDFVALSFYKIFGFPDLGGLIVRKSSAHILLWRKYFGGGTVTSLTVFHEATHRSKDTTIHDGLEDGTLPFHNIVALGLAMNVHQELFESMAKISEHTMFLAKRLFNALSALRHYNGRPICEIYVDASNTAPYTDPKIQGATVAFNVLRANGSYVPYSTVESVADSKDIYVRAGGLCNPGGIASYLRDEPWHFKRAWSAGHRCSGGTKDLDVIGGKPTGVVRASLGAMSIASDVDTFIEFMRETFIEPLPLSSLEDSGRAFPFWESMRHPTLVLVTETNAEQETSTESISTIFPTQHYTPELPLATKTVRLYDSCSSGLTLKTNLDDLEPATPVLQSPESGDEVSIPVRSRFPWIPEERDSGVCLPTTKPLGKGNDENKAKKTKPRRKGSRMLRRVESMWN